MSNIKKVLNDDGTFDVLANNSVVRTSVSKDDADDVVAMLLPMEMDED